MTAALLDQSAAVELGCALVAYVAEEAGIRSLLIKGHALAEHGLREPRRYADVDVWIAPESVTSFVDLLRERGWHERGPNWVLERVGNHSVTLVNDHWPCDIDVHLRFPGFLAPDDVVFDELWRRRSSIVLGGRDVVTTDRAGNAAVLALHSLRQEWNRHQEVEFEHLIALMAADPELLAGVLDIAAVTGANETLAPLFARLGVTAKPGFQPSERALREWSARKAHVSRTGRWLTYFRSIPLRRWPREIRIAIWPSPELFRQDHPEVPQSGWALFRGRMRRLVNGGTGMIRIARARISSGRRPGRH
ncbi:nucleotidyltransferase family protein [Herbiconiux sp. P17]|uniref:nucleotidyltransferase family protein n=1 Tax=Herbiconiux wuyangfengii TaxID=3342794 RepID=UPI0035B6C6B4